MRLFVAIVTDNTDRVVAGYVVIGDGTDHVRLLFDAHRSDFRDIRVMDGQTEMAVYTAADF